MTATSAIRNPLWAMLRTQDAPTSVADLAQALAAPASTIGWRLSRWAKAGLLTAIKPANDAPQEPGTSCLHQPVPMPHRPPSMPCCALRPNAVAARQWRAIRVKKRFDLVELMVMAEVSEASAKVYVSALLRAGILRRDVRGNHITGRRSIYALNGQFGPKPPVIHQHREDGRTLTSVTDPTPAPPAKFPRVARSPPFFETRR
jgi:DNA-binding Lrp family transcriptional regulator